MKPSLTTNIYCLYLIKLSKWFMLIMPVVALFYAENGLDTLDIYLLQAVYCLSVACLEIPSGYMADIIGRRKSLIAGSILGTLGFIIYSLSYTLCEFAVAEIILGLGGSFISGSDSALLYDSLAARNKSHLYLRYEGRITSLGNFAETGAAVCGGLIATLVSYRGVYIGQALLAAVAIPAAFMLVEPERAKLAERPGIRQILSICYQAVIVNKKLSSTILFSSVIGTCTLCMAWTAQIYFIHHGLDELTITPLWVILNLTVAVVAARADRVLDFLGFRSATLLIIIIIPSGFILLGLLPLSGGLFTLLLFYGIRGYATPVLKDLTNMHCRSEIRATVLSIRSLIIRVGFAILGPLMGAVSTRAGFSYSLIYSGSALLCLSLVFGCLLYVRLPETFTKTG